MKWKQLIIVMVLVCSLILTSCRTNEQGDSQLAEGEAPESLEVFIVSDAVHAYYAKEDREEIYYTTLMNIGDFFGIAIEYGSAGHIFADTFERYQKETGIQLNLHWYQYPEQMEADLESLSENEQPDLILTNFTSLNDYNRYVDQGLFYDLTDLFAMNEMYSGDQYYNQILRGGEYKQKQYIVPILFNIDTVMGAEQYWKDLGLYFENAERPSEVIDMLIYAQKSGQKEQTTAQFVDAGETYLPYILYDSVGESWVDYENQTVQLDEEYFAKMCTFYTQYVQEQLDEDEIVKGQKLNWSNSKHVDTIKMISNAVQVDEFLDEMGCILEGGGAFKAELHSAIAQAWYYESRYTDLGETFVIEALPGESGGTTAHISYFGAVMETTEYPQTSFAFLKYLMDEEIPAFFGISVNRENAMKQLDYVTSTTYRLRHSMVPLEDGTIPDAASDYVMQPMSESTRDKLVSMIDNIDQVSLPNWPAYAILQEQLLSCAKEEISAEEAYQNALAGLEAYLKEAQ